MHYVFDDWVALVRIVAPPGCPCSRSGAVRFGQQPGSFTARRCRLSYGVEWYRRWTEEDEQHRQAHGYPVKVVRAEDGIEHAGRFVDRWRCQYRTCLHACPNGMKLVI